MKSCSKSTCKQKNPQELSQFSKRKDGKLGLSSNCKSCKIIQRVSKKEAHKQYKRSYYLANKDKSSKIYFDYINNKNINKEKTKLESKKRRLEKKRQNRLKYQYNITIEDYNKMYIEQEGKCYTCQKHQNDLKFKLVVDHCHKTGKVRGLLCDTCNSGIGFLKEDIDTILRVIQYLKKNRM